jgi:hypothetical protein
MAAPLKTWVLLETLNKTNAYYTVMRILVSLHQLFIGSDNNGIHFKISSLALLHAHEKTFRGLSYIENH